MTAKMLLAPPAVVAPSRPKTLREICEHAARIIEEQGWWDGGNYAGKKECILTAIEAVPGIDSYEGELYLALAAAINVPVRSGADAAERLIEFNDYPGRTREEILAVLRSVQ